MKLKLFLLLLLVCIISLYFACNKKSGIDDRKPVPAAINPSSQPNELNRALIIKGAIKKGGLPSTVTQEDVVINISVPSALVTKDNFLFLPFAFTVKNSIQGMYIQVKGSEDYWDVPIKLANVKDNSSAIAIGIPAFIKEGDFELIYKLYNSANKVSTQQAIKVKIAPSENSCINTGYPRVEGQDGITVKTYDFGDQPGTIEIDYYMYTQKDRMDIRYNGKWIKSTSNVLLEEGQAPPFRKCSEATIADGFVSNGGKFTINYDPKISREVSIYISGCLEGGTLWYFDVKCPANSGTGIPVICGNGTAQDFYDKTNSSYHRYPTEENFLTAEICNTTDAGCSVPAVYNAMLKQSNFIGPTRDVSPVTDCKVTWVRIVTHANPIVSKVDRANYMVTNYTLANYKDQNGISQTHLLHPGKVVRTVKLINGRVVVKTQGEGTGSYKSLNQMDYLTGMIWKKEVDQNLKKYWDKLN